MLSDRCLSVCPVCDVGVLWPNSWIVGWIRMPLDTEVGLGPGDIGLDGTQLPKKGDTAAPTFRPMSIVAKRSPISATAELLFTAPGPPDLYLSPLLPPET